ncbi:MAG: peptidylprolyl isomerase [Planctomycetota bacterium]
MTTYGDGRGWYALSHNLTVVAAAGLALATCPAVSSAEVGTVVQFRFTSGGEDFGAVGFRLYDTAMPRSVENFLNYLDRYEGTFVHRNPRAGDGGPNGDFVVQGGGFSYDPITNFVNGIATDDPIADEPGGGVQGISNLRGTLSNAKSGPDTVTSQWFFNLDDNSFLDSPARNDGGFGAFGRIIGSGITVLDDIDALEKINIVPSAGSLFADTPVEDLSDPLNTLIVLAETRIVPYPPGDYNFDFVVDSDDYNVWRSQYGSTTRAEADGNGDGVVDARDYTLWRDNVTAEVAAAVAPPAPEPSAALLGILTVFAAPRRRRQR